MTRQIRLLVNPSAGEGPRAGTPPGCRRPLRDGGANLEILLSRDFAEAKSMAHQAIADGVDVLAVMGGDGMMHLGVNTSAAAHAEGRSRTTLGLIPAGTGNTCAAASAFRPKTLWLRRRLSPQATAAQSILLEWPRPMSRRCLPPVSTHW